MILFNNFIQKFDHINFYKIITNKTHERYWFHSKKKFEDLVSQRNWFYLVILAVMMMFERIEGCNSENKYVGACLHVYLERDFLSLEKIIYPSTNRNNNRYVVLYKSNHIKTFFFNFKLQIMCFIFRFSF